MHIYAYTCVYHHRVPMDGANSKCLIHKVFYYAFGQIRGLHQIADIIDKNYTARFLKNENRMQCAPAPWPILIAIGINLMLFRSRRDPMQFHARRKLKDKTMLLPHTTQRQ